MFVNCDELETASSNRITSNSEHWACGDPFSISFVRSCCSSLNVILSQVVALVVDRTDVLNAFPNTLG